VTFADGVGIDLLHVPCRGRCAVVNGLLPGRSTAPTALRKLDLQIK
jgi:hypothetical protein